MRFNLSILIVIAGLISGCFEKKTVIEKTVKDNKITTFKYIEKSYQTNNKLIKASSVRWYADFESIRKTVLFKDLFISFANTDGLICLNANNFEINQQMNNKLNTDYFTNINIFQDTLIAEKYGKIFYLNSDTNWVEYTNLLPIKYFDILYDDYNYVLYRTDCGEFGGLFFMYNKINKKTKILASYSNIVQVSKINNTFLIEDLYVFHSSFGYITNMDSIGIIEKHPENYFDCFKNDNLINYDKFLVQSNVNNDEYKPIFEYYRNVLNHFSPPPNISFFVNGRKYYFVLGSDSLNISYLEKLEYKPIQKFRKFDPTISRSFGNTTILNIEYDRDVIIIRNDTIVRIHFNSLLSSD
jgi:hypothetical protein